MKQLFQVLKDGSVRLDDVPDPPVLPGTIRVRNRASVISAGTERMKVETGRLSLIGKARARPDQVRKILDTIRQQGVRAAYEKVRSRLERYSPLGYSCCGVVEEVAPDVEDIRPGDVVACAGQDIANHAEVVVVPERLAVRVPEGVAAEDAAFATIGAIALQSLRQARIEVGETVGVIGLGLLGQLVAQLCRAAGARVVGVDISPERVALAASLGVECARVRSAPDLLDAAKRLTDGHGLDAVIVTASTSSNDPVMLAVELARDRARVVFLGNTKIDLPWNDYYLKELTVLFSRSYGAGRYDPLYERQGVDYPIGYARWTIQRNMRAFLQQVADRRLQLSPLVTERIPFAEAARAYDLLTAEGAGPVALLLSYAAAPLRVSGAPVVPAALATRSAAPRPGTLGLGVIGAGNFAQSMLLPTITRLRGVRPTAVTTRTGTSAQAVAERFGFARAESGADAVLAAPDVDVVLIATRHGDHAELASRALRAGKTVFVEKPLALDDAQLSAVTAAARDSGHDVLVGFNRRFAPLSLELKAFAGEVGGPFEIVYRVNAGAMEPSHWYFDPVEGGGRIIGEACHFLDYLVFVSGSPITSVSARTVRGNTGRTQSDNTTILTALADGSIGTVHYFADGNPQMAKEYIEVFGRGASARLENFQRLELWRGRRPERRKAAADKGHAAEMLALCQWARREIPCPIPLSTAVNVTQASFAAVRSAARDAEVIHLNVGPGESS